MTRRAVLLCGHGSRDPAAEAEFEDAAAGLRRRLSAYDFGVGYLEFSRPTIPDGLAALAARGAGQITAVPGMLFGAPHVKTDLPRVIGRFAAAHPEVELRLARALAGEPKLLDAAADRIAAAAPPPRDAAALVVVGRGTGDPAANAELAGIAGQLRQRLGFAAVETGFCGLAEPRVAVALQRAAGCGFARIVVFPYLLFGGILAGRIRDAVAAASAEYPGIDFVAAGHLGAHPLVLDALADRVGELR